MNARIDPAQADSTDGAAAGHTTHHRAWWPRDRPTAWGWQSHFAWMGPVPCGQHRCSPTGSAPWALVCISGAFGSSAAVPRCPWRDNDTSATAELPQQQDVPLATGREVAAPSRPCVGALHYSSLMFLQAEAFLSLLKHGNLLLFIYKQQNVF